MQHPAGNDVDTDLDTGITITAVDDAGDRRQIVFLPLPPAAGLGSAEDRLRDHGWVIERLDRVTPVRWAAVVRRAV